MKKEYITFIFTIIGTVLASVWFVSYTIEKQNNAMLADIEVKNAATLADIEVKNATMLHELKEYVANENKELKEYITSELIDVKASQKILEMQMKGEYPFVQKRTTW